MNNTNLDQLYEACRDVVEPMSDDSKLKDALATYLARKLVEKKVMVMPYMLGDKLYRACSWFDQVDELTVSMITQKKDGSFKIRMTSSLNRSVQDFTLENIMDPKYDIYYDKEEAEEAHKKAREARFEALKQKVATIVN